MAKKRKSKSKAYEYSFSMKDNYVFYERLNDDNTSQSHIWKKIYTTAMSEFSDGLTFFNVVNPNIIGNSLISQGYIEQKKELNFLEQAFGIQNNKIHISEYTRYIKQINDIIRNIDEYKRVSNLLKSDKAKKTTSKENLQSILFAIDKSFYSYFYQDLTNFFNRNNDIIYLNNITAFTIKIEEIASRAIEKSIKNLNIDKLEVKNDNVKIWLDVLRLLQKSEKHFQKLNSTLFQRYDLDSILSNLYKWNKDRKKNNIKGVAGLSKQIKINSEIKAKEFNNIDKIIKQVGNFLSGNYSLTESGTKKIGKTETNIQNIQLFSVAGRIGLDGILEQYSNEILSENSLEDIALKIENFTNKISSFRDIFVIYEAVDLDIDKGLTGSYSLSMLPSFLDRIGTKIDGNKLVSVLYNTIPGAIGADRIGEIKENISLAMSEAIAGYLFQDWESIGNSTSNNIHIFNLDGIKIPLSYLLIAIGQTILDISSNPTSYFDVDFNLPNGILYPETINPFNHSIGMEGYWDEQRQVAIGDSTFSIRFLEGFKGKIRNLLGKM